MVSTLAIILGGLFIMYMRIASWRIVAGVAGGGVLRNLAKPNQRRYEPYVCNACRWHFVVGGLLVCSLWRQTQFLRRSQTR